MARAETIETVGETGGRGGNGPLPHHSTCRMELPRPFQTWPALLTTTTITTAASGTGGGAVHLHHHQLHPLCLLSLPDGPQTQQQPPALAPATPPPSLLCSQREERDGGAATHGALSGEEPGSDRWQEASSRLGPLPDLLPHNEHPSGASPLHHRASRAATQQEVRRVALQLRAIGDDLNTTVLRRANVAPHWQDLRDACRGLVSFIAQTLSALYRLT